MVNINTRKPLEFQLTDWRSFDFKPEFNPETDKGRYRKEFRVQIFGVTSKGRSVSVIVKGFKPFFYAEIPDEWNKSESKVELDRFCDAMLEIRKEIDSCSINKVNNLLKNSPHTLEMVTSDNWPFEYSRAQAAYPLDFTKDNKFWASVRRVDDAYGDRNLICSCAPIESYTE